MAESTAPLVTAHRPPLPPSYLKPGGAEPIRAELYSLESLAVHARELAAAGRTVRQDGAGGPLLRRFAHNGRVLERARRRIAVVSARQEPLTADAEWLLDNYHIVEENLREVRHDLPRGYYRELPKLTAGPLAGYPRVYALALTLIAHTDSILDEAHITRFVHAYQAVTPLTIGELWAVPTMLRLGLVENLGRLAGRMLAAWDERRRAEDWVASFGTPGEPAPAPAPVDLPSPARVTDAFAVRALQVLRDHGAPETLQRAERLLAGYGLPVAEVVRRANQRQALDQVSVGNCVTSLRLLSALDWGQFFETTNLVEPVLREDPAGVYARQDFASRDRCRRAVERLARGSRHSEVEVARRAVRLAAQARAAPTAGTAVPTDHVGYYLIGPGRAVLEGELRYRPRLRERVLQTILGHPQAVYFGALATLTGLFLAAFGMLQASGQPGHAGVWVLFFLAALLPSSELAVGLVNYVLTLILPPRVLPKLDFKDGIPADAATFVVMPSMLTRPRSAANLLERLEIHYLANPDPNLWFALLTDFGDSPTEHRPEDEAFVRAALDGVRALNERYAGQGPPRFFLFHRRRLWNPGEGCWMGWERKRGKLEEFNRLLRGDAATSYTVRSGDLEQLPPIRYVITLDLDTQLPRETARRLVGTLAHPLNRAHFDPRQGRVVEGYSILQPRVSFHLTAANQSLFTRIWAASAGVDPYSTAVSDIYQDLFGAGSFTGKGIYELDAFEAATGRTFPENHILSHDLIEGNYAGCGLVTDIELFDDFPARYHTFARREHRWVRGDWQLLPWLGRTVPVPSSSADGAGSRIERRPNPLPILERWKILDNLRRSLIPPAMVLWLVLSFTVLPVSAWLGLGFPLLILALPLTLQVLGGVVQALRARSLAPVRELGKNILPTLGQAGLMAVFLLFQTYQAVDAIVRTLRRLFLTQRHLLEWETAASAERRLGTGLRHFLRAMWQAPALAVALTMLIGLARPDALLPASLFLIPWFLSPLVAFLVSQPIPAGEAALGPDERAEMGRIARRTWRYFEDFVGDADHWLPPDNFQEEPTARVAHRTSPTNQGLLLLATLAAHDLGYLSLANLVERLEKTLATLDRLPRHRGHFFNWYNTLTLEPLQPTYISTVDSGNLVGCLVTLKQGLLEKMEQPILGLAQIRGLRDTLSVVTEVLQEVPMPNDREAVHRHGKLQALVQTLAGRLQDCPTDLAGWHEWLSVLGEQTGILSGQAHRLAEYLSTVSAEVAWWVEAFARQVRDLANELAELAPWSDSAQNAPAQGAIRDELGAVFSLAEVGERRTRVVDELTALEKDLPVTEDRRAWVRRVHEALQNSSAPALLDRCRQLADWADALAAAMDFRFLYKPDRHLFAIGYNVAQDRLDESAYDLLASEARLASFLAIARGEMPPRHWFHLGRLLTRVGTRLCLLSWGGTMFEYLMPQLLLRRYPGTLLAESCDAAVARQMAYGRETGVPWGVSESAFSSQYAGYDYQYQSFGVPGLGLKRDLNQDLVVAPYATALAALVRPREALHNLRRLRRAGAAGRYGFYEAIDFTRRRLPAGRRSLVVRCFMAHHQGMSLVALANCLLGDPMVRRFHAEPLVRATELLLQERVPGAVTPVEPLESAPPSRPADTEGQTLLSRRLTTPFTPSPRTHLLSNGRYSVMVTNAGAGFSRWGDLDVTRWREDATRDALGQFCYIRDLRSGLLWSAGYHPVGRLGDEFEVIYSADKAEFRRVDGLVASHLEVTVSPEHPAEVRRLTLMNHDTQDHDLEVTSYAEIVLGPHGADLAHPAFSKLFLETEWVSDCGALLCRRRPRAPEQTPVWAVHVAPVDGPAVGAVQFETDRARFLGRCRSPGDPAALEPGAVLTGTTGPVLDPIFSLRRRLRLAPGRSATITFCTAVARSREDALALAGHYDDPQAILRTFDLAWAQSQVELRHLRLSTAEAILFQRLASYLLYARPALRASGDVFAANRQGQSDLWRYGISGDRPIVLARIATADELALVRQLLGAHTYWRLRGLEVDLVIICDRPAGYFEELFQQIQADVRSSDAHDLADKPGGVFVRRASHIPEEDKILLQAAARVVLTGERGSLAAQLDRADAAGAPAAPPAKRRRRRRFNRVAPEMPVALPTDLVFRNGLGGFTPDGREYCILADRPADGVPSPELPPAPWVNVIANPAAGFLVSEGGFGSTWVGNSQANRLTPWSNDPVLDPPAEVVYLRDEDTEAVWTPTPRPLGGAAPTLVRHGQGYTRFRRHSHGLDQELIAFVPPDDPLKVILLRVRNAGDRPRRLSGTYYAEWVLGTVRDRAALEVITEVDPETGALLARNPFNADFAGQVAFADVSLRPRALTADRTEFLGHNGAPAAPAGLDHPALSGRAGPALDPCAAVQASFTLAAGEERDVVFLLGACPDRSMARELVRKYREPGRARAALEEVKAHWEQVLGAVQVRTPDAALDVLLNRWLIYQVLSCRLWGRSAFYQSGGAYGFRDQLQDIMALVYGAPEQARAHILRAAGRQFLEGDVQHWWHPPTGRGIRTRIVDDCLWLPFVVSHYVTATGDRALLDERVPYLRAPDLQPGQEDDYRLPETADESGTVYEHCVRGLRHSLRYGVHGLPLMGTGDWNDGMNRVGAGGKGESVWAGWFLLTCLKRFAELAEGRGDSAWAAACREHAERLRRAIEEHGWDGRWYRRAYFDDGTPLGSEANDECQIDAIAQAWAVLSGAADPTRARQALAAVDERLVGREDGLIRLLAPPFDRGRLQPGYIKGYVPGIRENGGQYTHAAAWVVQAVALLGDGTRAVELLDLLNPIRHAASPEGVARYRTEPYVLAGDVYGAPPHTGRGGWTWYTGSAAWFYRVALESVLGFQLQGDRLTVQPCIPRAWPSFALTFRYGSATYHITVENPQAVERGVAAVFLDGQPRDEQSIPLVDDGRPHLIRVMLGA